eukprot:604875-Amphidinium_carterae.1
MPLSIPAYSPNINYYVLGVSFRVHVRPMVSVAATDDETSRSKRGPIIVQNWVPEIQSRPKAPQTHFNTQNLFQCNHNCNWFGPPDYKSDALPLSYTG